MIYSMFIGYFRPPPRRRPPPITRIPLRREGAKISPAGLVYLFPEIFVKEPIKGGFRAPCTGFSINMGQLFYLMLAATYISMDYDRVIKITRAEEGIISKINIINITKLVRHRPGIYGYLSRNLDNLKVGSTIRLYDLIVEDEKYSNPGEYFVSKVFNYDLAGRGLFYGENPENPICSKIIEYKITARRLHRIIAEFRRHRPNTYNTIMEEGKRILEAMSK